MTKNATPEVADELVDAAPSGAQVALVNPIELALAGVKTFVKDAERTVYDIETYAGEQTARQLRQACVKHRTGAKSEYEMANAPFLEAQRKARELVGEIVDLVSPLEDRLDAEIKAKEERKAVAKRIAAEAAAKRLAEIRGRLDAIGNVLVGVATGTAAEIQAAINQLFQAPINEELFGDFAEEASARSTAVILKLTELHDKVHAREQEQLELARQREELAEQQRKLAAEKAEQAAKEKAERLRVARIHDYLLAISENGTDAQRLCGTVEEMERCLAHLDKRPLTQAMYQEFYYEAVAVTTKTRQVILDTIAAKRVADVTAAEKLVEAMRTSKTSDEPVPKQDDEAEKAPAAAKIEAEQAPVVVNPVVTEGEFRLTCSPAGVLRDDPIVYPAGSDRPDDEEILATLARNFDVSQHEVLEWITAFDVDAQAQRLKEIA